jgi:hypothetical protein
MGLLGTVGEHMYHEYLREQGGVVDAFSSQTDHVEDEAEEAVQSSSQAEGDSKMTKMERYYFNVVIRELSTILRDSNLWAHHSGAAAAALRAFRVYGPEAQQYLSILLDSFVYRLNQTEVGKSVVDSLLDHLIMLIHIMGKVHLSTPLPHTPGCRPPDVIVLVPHASLPLPPTPHADDAHLHTRTRTRTHAQIVRKYLESHFIPILVKFLDAHLQPCLDMIESLSMVLRMQVMMMI